MELGTQVFTERLNYREDNFTCLRLDCIALKVVKLTIDIGLLIGIQPVQVHHLQQRYAIDCSSRNIGQFITRRVAQVLDVKFKVILLNGICTQGIDILHCQIPHGIIG